MADINFCTLSIRFKKREVGVTPQFHFSLRSPPPPRVGDCTTGAPSLRQAQNRLHSGNARKQGVNKGACLTDDNRFYSPTSNKDARIIYIRLRIKADHGAEQCKLNQEWDRRADKDEPSWQ